MATRKKKATRKGAPKGKTKRSATTSKRKTAKKTKRKKPNRKAILTALIRKPMAELVKKGGLISEAITVKVQNQLRRTGQLSGPVAPTKAQRAAMKKEAARAAKLRRLDNLERARATRVLKKQGFIGPMMSNEALEQRALLRKAGVAGY
jgi:hypothetical protein